MNVIPDIRNLKLLNCLDLKQVSKRIPGKEEVTKSQNIVQEKVMGKERFTQVLASNKSVQINGVYGMSTSTKKWMETKYGHQLRGGFVSGLSLGIA